MHKISPGARSPGLNYAKLLLFLLSDSNADTRRRNSQYASADTCCRSHRETAVIAGAFSIAGIAGIIGNISAAGTSHCFAGSRFCGGFCGLRFSIQRGGIYLVLSVGKLLCGEYLAAGYLRRINVECTIGYREFV